MTSLHKVTDRSIIFRESLGIIKFVLDENQFQFFEKFLSQ